MKESFETQKQVVRKALEDGRTLTSWGVIQEWRITRLASIIHRLRGEGVSISDKWEQNSIKRWKVYYINWPNRKPEQK